MDEIDGPPCPLDRVENCCKVTGVQEGDQVRLWEPLPYGLGYLPVWALVVATLVDDHGVDLVAIVLDDGRELIAFYRPHQWITRRVLVAA